MNSTASTHSAFASPANRRATAAIVLLALLVGLSLGWRLALIRAAAVNPDEFFTMGGAWRVSQGRLPFIDYPDAHSPLLSRLYAPLIATLGERSDALDFFRLLNWFWTSLFCFLFYRLVKKARGRATAWWALGIQCSFLFFAQRTVFARPDVPALLLTMQAAYWLLDLHSTWKRRGAALLLGLATAIYLPIAFMIAGVCVWLAIVEYLADRLRHAGTEPLWFGAWTVAAFLLGYALVFGPRLADGLIAQTRLFAFEALYQGAAEIDSWKIFVSLVVGSPLPWLLVAIGVAVFLFRLFRGRLTDPADVFFVLLAIAGLAIPAARRHAFEQHYFFFVLFGAVPAASWIDERLGRSRKRLGAAGVHVAAALLALLLLASTIVMAVRAQQAMTARDRLDLAARPAPVLDAAGALNADSARLWLLQKPEFFHPFHDQPKTRRLAQFRFLLAASHPGDTVFSDWLGPPYRELPWPSHHGYLTHLLYRSPIVAADAGLTALMQKYDPTYDPRDAGEAAHFIRLFAARPPRVVLLEGSLARLFCESEPFRVWLAERFRFVYEPVSGSLFALAAANPS